MYHLEIKPSVNKILTKLAKKHPEQLRIIRKKIDSIRNNPHHTYKFLRPPFYMFNRVHIDKHFVLIFRIDHKLQLIDVHHYGHHDKAYQWRPKD